MQLTYRTLESVLIATLSGHFLRKEVPTVRQQLTQIIKQDTPYLILDLAPLMSIDASGLSVFISALKVARQYKGDVLLLNPTPTVRAMIELVRLQHTFNIYKDEVAALADCVS